MSENLPYIELSARLHFSENHIKYLSSELAKSNAKIEELENEAKRAKELEIELNRITELLKLAVKKTYAPSSEKGETSGQLSFLEEDENKEKPAPKKCEVKSYSRAPKRSYKDIYKNLPIEIKEYDISETEKICEACGTEMVCIGYDS